MTAAVLTQLPLAAGSALAATIGRVASWGLEQYSRAPLSNTAILGLATFSLMASTNALYFQEHAHPSPLFGAPGSAVLQPAPRPVIPKAGRPKLKPAPTLTGSIPAKAPVAASTKPIGNAEVFELQRKLQAIGLFDGKVDGLYGPRTARAIKKFEQTRGLTPKGELTPSVLEAILKADLLAPPPAKAELTSPEPVPELKMPTETPSVLATATLPVPSTRARIPVAAPATASTDPLPTPAPLQASVEPASAGGSPPSSRRPLPANTDEAIEIASGVASDAVNAVVAVANGNVQLGPREPVATQTMTPIQPAAPATQQATVAPRQEMPEELPAPAEDQVAAIVTQEMAPVATAPKDMVESHDPRLVAQVQRGLASLGFLSGEIDGRPGEATAKAIRNFEVWNNYDVTGRVTPQLLDLLTAAGAEI